MSAIPTSQKKPFIPAPGVLQVEMIYRSNSQICENVYHVQVGAGTAPATEAQMDTVAAAFNQWEAAQGVNARCSLTALNLIRVRQMDTSEPLIKEYTPVGNVIGQGAPPSAPGNVTYAVRWSTGKGGRSNRGRTYHIGTSLSNVSGNVLIPAVQTQVTANYTALLTALNALSGVKLGVLSFSHNKFWRSTAQFTVITGLSIDPNLDSQRRRLNGRGN